MATPGSIKTQIADSSSNISTTGAKYFGTNLAPSTVAIEANASTNKTIIISIVGIAVVGAFVLLARGK